MISERRKRVYYPLKKHYAQFGALATACGRDKQNTEYREDWQRVTCKQCLKHRGNA